MVANGYDRDIAAIRSEPATAGPAARLTARATSGYRNVRLDRTTGLLTVPSGCALDLGATAKAFTADLAARSTFARYGSPVLVELGGGTWPVAGPKRVGGWGVLAAEAAGGDGQIVTVTRGGVTTSTTTVRRWQRGGAAMHHIVDPATGAPADGPWRTATVWAESALAANTASTAAIVLGAGAGPPARSQPDRRSPHRCRRRHHPDDHLAGRRSPPDARGRLIMELWMTARGAGLAALVLLISTALGALGSPNRTTTRHRMLLQYVHRSAGALGLGVLVLHVVTIMADSYANVSVTGAIIPFTASYRATWVGLGTITMYLLVLVAGFGFARGRMAASVTGARIWRSTHALAYLAWVTAIAHGYLSGTDSSVPWVIALYVCCSPPHRQVGSAMAGPYDWAALTAPPTSPGPTPNDPHRYEPKGAGPMTATLTAPLPTTSNDVWTIGAPRLLAGLDRHAVLDRATHLATHGPLPATDLRNVLALLDASRLTGRGGAGSRSRPRCAR